MRKRAPLSKLLVFAPGERNGVFALGFLTTCFWALPAFTGPWLAAPPTDFSDFKNEIAAFRASLGGPVAAPVVALFPFDPNRATADEFVRLGLPLRTANQICNYREKGGQFRQPDDFKKIYGLSVADFERLRPFIFIEKEGDERPGLYSKKEGKRPAENFRFDPNTASFDDFERLGLDGRVAQSILNYRSKGGVFRKKEDFSKIYTLPAADFQRLEPFIDLPEKFSAPPVGQPSDGSPAPSKTGAQATTFFQKTKQPTGKIDINRADAADWKELPGIGDYYSQRIVSFRERLGGFFKIEQVAETRGLPDSTFQKIQPWLILETPVFRKINLNTTTVDELKAHPYFDRRLAEAIVAYRTAHGPFKNTDGLHEVKAIRRDWFGIIMPYLTVE